MDSRGLTRNKEFASHEGINAKGIAKFVLVTAAAAVLISMVPGLKRYLKISSM